MPNLKQRITGYLQSLIPTRRVTVFSPNAEPAALAHALDADRVHQILRNAEGGDTRELFALYRDILIADSHLQGEFNKRKLAVLGDTLNVLPVDKQVAADVKAQAFIKGQVESCPAWINACAHLLNSALWPVAVLEKVFKPGTTAGVQFDLAALIPVPDQLLDFTTGTLRVRDTDPATGMPLGTSHAPDPNRYIIHRGHLLPVPDNWGGPMRSLVFWWLLSAMDRDWWARFLERYGAPFLLGKYDQADDASRSVLERAFSFAVKIGGLVVSKETEVEIKQAAAAQSADAYERFHELCNREKSKLIIGQVLSSTAVATGLGSGVATSQEKVRQDIRQFDAAMLAQTLKDQLFKQILAINSVPGRVPMLAWGGAESAEQAQVSGAIIQSLAVAGLEVTDAGLELLSQRLGFPVQRKAVLPGSSNLPLASDLLSLTALANAGLANDALARSSSAGLAQAFRGHLAPVRLAILQSSSPEDLEKRLLAMYSDWPKSRTTPLVEAALQIYAANGGASRS